MFNCDNKCECECKCKCECCKCKFNNEFKNKCGEKIECKKYNNECEHENYNRCECFCKTLDILLENCCNVRKD